MNNKDKILKAADTIIKFIDELTETEVNDIIESLDAARRKENPAVYFESLKVGDQVLVECYSSMGGSSVQAVTELKTKFDENTGDEYLVICCDDHEFSGVHGGALNEPTMYYIVEELY